jgi:hypothetical protein
VIKRYGSSSSTIVTAIRSSLPEHQILWRTPGGSGGVWVTFAAIAKQHLEFLCSHG